LNNPTQPGGAILLRKYAIRDEPGKNDEAWRDASWAFHGGLNNHSRAAKRRMREMRIAKVSLDVAE
jgi:stearoyl-CoA desaturase (delta-9 desaturase)